MRFFSIVTTVAVLSVLLTSVFRPVCGAFENDDEIMRFYYEAERAYSWFTGYNEITGDYRIGNRDLSEAVYGEDIGKRFEADGVIYRIIPYEQINTTEKMRSFLLHCFPLEQVNELMNKNYDGIRYFTERDGYLYELEGNVSEKSGAVYPVKFKVTEKNDDRIILRAAFSNIEDSFSVPSEITYDYIIEKNNNGQWIFTNFVFPSEVFKTDKYDSLISDAYYLYLFLYEDGSVKPYIDKESETISVKVDDYNMKIDAAKINEEFDTVKEFTDHCGGFLRRDIAEQVFRETIYVRLYEGKIIQLELSPQYIIYNWIQDAETAVIKESGGKRVLEREFMHILGGGESETVKFTFEISEEDGKTKITGGSFVEEMLQVNTLNNSETADGPVLITAAAAIASLAGVVLCRRKGK